METLDVFVADSVSKSFIRIIHGILVFFSSLISVYCIHTPPCNPRTRNYLHPPIHRHSNFVHVPAVNPTVATTHQSFRNPAQQLAFDY